MGRTAELRLTGALLLGAAALAFFPDQVPALTVPMDTSSMPMDSMSM